MTDCLYIYLSIYLLRTETGGDEGLMGGGREKEEVEGVSKVYTMEEAGMGFRARVGKGIVLLPD